MLKSKEALERRGHKVVLYNQWTDKLSDADIVHQFSVQGGTYNICDYAQRHKIPLVLSPILWLSEYIDQYPMGEIAAMLQMADIICPNSHAEVAKFLTHFSQPEEKYHVTHNGVNACFFDPVTPDLFLQTFHIKIPFVLCVGNIEVRKNQLALLEACNLIGIQCVLIGNIRDESYFQEMNKRFSENFTHLGYMDHDSQVLRSAYAACSVFALPSLLETPGLAALEASAVGTPLVITKEGCTEEYFGKEAYYVDPKNSSDIAEKLQVARNSKGSSNKLSKRIREFSWDRVGEELEQAYIKAIKH